MIVIEHLHPQEENKVLNRWEFDRTHPSISIGRCSNNDITLPNKLVSRRHIILTQQGSDWKCENFGGNGCYINEKKVDTALLRQGKAGIFKIRLGKLGPRLRVRIDSPKPVATAPQPDADGGKIYISRSIREYAARRQMTLTGERTLTMSSETVERDRQSNKAVA